MKKKFGKKNWEKSEQILRKQNCCIFFFFFSLKIIFCVALMEWKFHLTQLNVGINKNKNKIPQKYTKIKFQQPKCRNYENYEKHKSFVIMSTENELPSPKNQRETTELKWTSKLKSCQTVRNAQNSKTIFDSAI